MFFHGCNVIYISPFFTSSIWQSQNALSYLLLFFNQDVSHWQNRYCNTEIHLSLPFLKRKQGEKHRNGFARGKQRCPEDFLKIFHASLVIPGGCSASFWTLCSGLRCEVTSMPQPYGGQPGKHSDRASASTKDFMLLTSLPGHPMLSLYFTPFLLFSFQTLL